MANHKLLPRDGASLDNHEVRQHFSRTGALCAARTVALERFDKVLHDLTEVCTHALQTGHWTQEREGATFSVHLAELRAIRASLG